MKPKFIEQAAAKGHDAKINWKKSGKIGKRLQVMLLINHTLLAMHGLHIKQHI